MSKLIFNKELSIVAIVILVLCMMVVPLPHIVMDSVIAFNIGITIIVLMVVIYMKSTLSLSSFPSILLVLTLIRIGITVSTSRLILLEGNAGDIINTFGKFVVGGNLIVGVIIFIIITIINFIVITKGSERVAEVAARFTLDAMPGKQMSIDADLKSGNLTNAQAKEQRNTLALESRLYGAMDGAMKFIKGDAIASIIDIVINLVGGIVVGMVINSMELGAALQKYTILTVGDGLVQQIPALIISLTAGLLITRVESDAENDNLGQTIINQVFKSHKALFAASSLLLLLAIVPGMPSLVFMFLFIFTLFIGYYLYSKSRNKNSSDQLIGGSNSQVIVEDTDKKSVAEISSGSLRQLVPLILCVSSAIKGTNKINQITSILSSLQQEIMLDLGVSIPTIIIRYNQEFLEDQYQILVYEIPATSGVIYWDYLLVTNNNPGVLSVLDETNSFANTMYFGHSELGYWYLKSNEGLCNEFSITYYPVETVLMLHFKYALKKYLPEFVGIQEIKQILDSMTDYQDLIRELLRVMPLNKITEVVQRLIREDISIRNFKIILDNLLEFYQKEKEIIIINEYIRKGLGRYIAYKFSAGSYVINCIYMSTDIENVVRESIRYNANGSYLALDPNITKTILDNISEIEKTVGNVRDLVILTGFDIRRYVRILIERRFPYLQVLSFQELEEYAEFNVVGVIEREFKLDDELDSLVTA